MLSQLPLQRVTIFRILVRDSDRLKGKGQYFLCVETDNISKYIPRAHDVHGKSISDANTCIYTYFFGTRYLSNYIQRACFKEDASMIQMSFFLFLNSLLCRIMLLSSHRPLKTFACGKIIDKLGLRIFAGSKVASVRRVQDY